MTLLSLGVVTHPLNVIQNEDSQLLRALHLNDGVNVEEWKKRSLYLPDGRLHRVGSNLEENS
jgi:hypothetical protein